MKRDIAFSGVLGLILGLCILLFVNWVKKFIPDLFSDSITAIVVFAILLLVALVEIPITVFALRLMSHSAVVSRKIIDGVFMFYVSFAAVYALIFILLASSDYANFGVALAALGLVRFASGVLIK